jgi:hypothetical protein
MRPGGLIVAVGDPKQAIYAWRGADSQSMQTIRQLAASWQDLSLTLTFRCPQAIVDRQQAHAPGFRAAPQAPQGSIIFLEGYTYDGPPRGWQWSSIDSPQVAVLCRNNAPLLSLAFKLLRQGIGVQMLGRDIGTNLIALARKLCPSDELSRLDCVTRIQSWRESEGASAIAAGHDSKAESITDRADCLLAVLSSTECSNAGEMRQLLEQMFAPSASQVVLSSIHRAKGLEWPYVFHLDPWRIPSRFAHSAEAKQQERNLQYVCETRTQSVLAHASLSEMESP